RAGLHLERPARHLLDPASNGDAMLRAQRERLQDQEIQGALEEIGLRAHGSSSRQSVRELRVLQNVNRRSANCRQRRTEEGAGSLAALEERVSSLGRSSGPAGPGSAG